MEDQAQSDLQLRPALRVLHPTARGQQSADPVRHHHRDAARFESRSFALVKDQLRTAGGALLVSESWRYRLLRWRAYCVTLRLRHLLRSGSDGRPDSTARV